MKKDLNFAQLQRRSFLKTLSKAGLGLPVVKASSIGAGMMLARHAEAAEGVKRVIFVYIPDGTPGGATSSFTPSSGMSLKSCSSPLESVKQNCVFFRGTSVMQGDSVNGGHGLAQRVLGGYNAPNTIDFALEDTIGATSPFGVIHAGVSTGQKDSISSKNRNQIQAYVDNPLSVFNKVFGGNTDLSDVGTKRKKSVLDVNRQALAKIQSRLGAFEKQRLDQHMAAIERLEDEIDLAASQSVPEFCKTPVWNTGGFSGPMTDDQFTTIFGLQADTIVLAMQCNMTKIASIQLGTHQADFSVPGQGGSYHGVIHGGGPGGYTAYRSYLCARVAQLIEKLRDAQDTDGSSMLESTLVVQVTDMGDGNAHSGTDAPFFLAGGSSIVRGGQVVSASRHTQILDTVLEAFGVAGTAPRYDSSAVSGVLV